MTQSQVPALREWGVNEEDTYFEASGTASGRFAGPAGNEPLAASPRSFEVRLNRSSRTLVWDGQDANLPALRSARAPLEAEEIENVESATEVRRHERACGLEAPMFDSAPTGVMKQAIVVT